MKFNKFVLYALIAIFLLLLYLTTIETSKDKKPSFKSLASSNKPVESKNPELENKINKLYVDLFRNRIQEGEYFLNDLYRFPTIEVFRDEILASSYIQMSNFGPDAFKYARFYIKFNGEPGGDRGGLKREWFKCIINEILNPRLGLFKYTTSNEAKVIPDKLEDGYYPFLGRLLAFGVCNQITVDAFFDKIVFKHILGIPCNAKDFEQVDPELYRNINEYKNSVEAEESVFNDLAEEGDETPLTKNNVDEYIKKYFERIYIYGLEKQCESIKSGFFEIIDKSLFKEWSESDLEFLICGERKIDIEILKSMTYYVGYSETDNIVKWFWEIFSSFSEEKKSQFLCFITSFTRLPAVHHGDNFITIVRARTSDKSLPVAHTCVKQIEIPRYKSKDILEAKILQALEYAGSGFEII